MGLKLSDALTGCRSVFWDSSPVIYSLTSGSPFHEVATRSFRFSVEQRHSLVISPITLAECLAGEIDPTRQKLITEFLDAPEFTLVPTEAKVATLAASIRRSSSIKLPDAIQLASAIEVGCDAILTNDFQFAKVVAPIRIILLSDLSDE